MRTEKLNKGVFYSLRVVALIYLMLSLMIVVLAISQDGQFLLGILAGGFIAGFMYLFYRASEEAKIGSGLGRILTGLCGVLFLCAMIAGAKNGMKWLGLLMALYWIYSFFNWQYADE